MRIPSKSTLMRRQPFTSRCLNSTRPTKLKITEKCMIIIQTPIKNRDKETKLAETKARETREDLVLSRGLVVAEVTTSTVMRGVIAKITTDNTATKTESKVTVRDKASKKRLHKKK